jgi:hypothetical protein
MHVDVHLTHPATRPHLSAKPVAIETPVYNRAPCDPPEFWEEYVQQPDGSDGEVKVPPGAHFWMLETDIDNSKAPRWACNGWYGAFLTKDECQGKLDGWRLSLDGGPKELGLDPAEYQQEKDEFDKGQCVERVK